LVGVELNPGPNPGKKQGKKKKKQASSKTKPGTSKKGSVKAQKLIINRNVSGYTSDAAAYLRTVLAPCAGTARIPDFNCLPTALVTLTNEVTVAANGSGIGGIYLGINNVGSAYYTESGTSTDTTFAYNAAVTLSGSSVLQANYSFVRPVSACLDIFFTGSSMYDSGIMTGWSLAYLSGSSEVLPTSLALAQACRSNQTGRLRNGMSVFYRPTDSSSFLFRPSGSATGYGTLGVHFTGAQSSSPFMVKLTVNYECIPSIDTFSNGTSTLDNLKPSPIDLQGHAEAINLTSRVKPFLTAEKGQQLTDSLYTVGNNFMTVWNAAKSVLGIGNSVSKLLL